MAEHFCHNTGGIGIISCVYTHMYGCNAVNLGCIPAKPMTQFGGPLPLLAQTYAACMPCHLLWQSGSWQHNTVFFTSWPDQDVAGSVIVWSGSAWVTQTSDGHLCTQMCSCQHSCMVCKARVLVHWLWHHATVLLMTLLVMRVSHRTLCLVLMHKGCRVLTQASGLIHHPGL